ncbi:MAG: ATP-binding protein [Deltaproteobacteria bacterium]
MFRIKIALLSVLISGLVLVGFGLYSFSVMKKVNMDRIDREILTLGQGHLTIGPPRGYWQNFEQSLGFIYREGRPENLIVLIKDPGSEVLFKSSQWPVEITEDAFPDFDRTISTGQPVINNRAGEERAANPQFGQPSDSPRRNPSDRGDEARNNRRRGPPAEAYKACEGKSEGSTAEFVDQRGETLIGTCEIENGKLVLRPYVNKGSRRVQVNEESRERPSPPSSASNSAERPMPRIKKPYFATIETPSGVWRTGIMGSERITMMVGMNMAGFYKDAESYRRAFLGSVPLALLILGVGGWVIARRALKPVALITRTAEAITVRDLDQRVPLTDSDSELSRLVEVINGMLDRLEKSFSQAIRFSGDAAHELQTPLTILQGELDDAVQHAPVGSEEQQRYSGLLEEVQKLKAIVQKLLILARVDAGRLELCLEPIDLSAMIESAVEDAGAIAQDLQIQKKILPGVIVKADPDLMGQVVRNLTSNAVKYNRANGLIKFQLSVRNNNALFTISNTGVSIPAKDREKIFDRFYRVDQSRSKTVSGTGLGLSLAREIVQAHGGKLRLDSDSGNVVSFTLSLPCSSYIVGDNITIY